MAGPDDGTDPAGAADAADLDADHPPQPVLGERRRRRVAERAGQVDLGAAVPDREVPEPPTAPRPVVRPARPSQPGVATGPVRPTPSAMVVGPLLQARAAGAAAGAVTVEVGPTTPGADQPSAVERDAAEQDVAEQDVAEQDVAEPDLAELDVAEPDAVVEPTPPTVRTDLTGPAEPTARTSATARPRPTSPTAPTVLGAPDGAKDTDGSPARWSSRRTALVAGAVGLVVLLVVALLVGLLGAQGLRSVGGGDAAASDQQATAVLVGSEDSTDREQGRSVAEALADSALQVSPESPVDTDVVVVAGADLAPPAHGGQTEPSPQQTPGDAP